MDDLRVGKVMFRCRERDWEGSFDFHIYGEDPIDNNKMYVGKLTFVEHKVGDIVEPTLQISRRQLKAHGNPLKQLAKDLAREGLLPEKLKPDKGELDSTNKHLEDMRRIVFDHYLGKNEHS